MQVRWESSSAATPMGQLAYFIEFLTLTGLWSRCQEEYPLPNPQARREAITSRPWLMSSIGRKTEHAGQTTITLTGLHAHFGKAKEVLTRVSAMLKQWALYAAEQFNPAGVWQLVCDHLKHILVGIGPPKHRRFLINHASAVG